MIDNLERNLNNLNDDLKTRFKKLVISQLSLLRYRDKNFNIKYVHAIGSEREASIAYNKDMNPYEEKYRTGEGFLNKNEKEKNSTRQRKERLDELETFSRRKVCVEKDVNTNKASALFPETEQRRLSANTSLGNYSDEHYLKTNRRQIVTHIKPKPSPNEKQPCRNSFVSTSSCKSQADSHLSLPSADGMNNTCYLESSLQYEFPECTNYCRTPRNIQQSALRFDKRREREINLSPERGKRNSYHGRHVRFDNSEIPSKYSKSTERSLQDSGSSTTQIPVSNNDIQMNRTGVKEVHNKLSSDEQCSSKAPLNSKHSKYYTPNIHHQPNDYDLNLYKSIVSKGMQKDKTTDIVSEKRQTCFANKTSDERSTDKSPVSVVLSPRIKKIQNILADYSPVPLSASVPASPVTEMNVTTEPFPECKVDKWLKLKEKSDDSRKRLEKEIPSHAKSDNSMTKDTKTTKQSLPIHELIRSGSPSPKVTLKSAEIDTATLPCKTICGKSESETRKLSAGRTMIVSLWLNRIDNLMNRIVKLVTNHFEDGVKNELWDDIQADLLSEEKHIEDVLSSLRYHNTDIDLEKAETGLREHLNKMIRLGVKQDAVLDYHINKVKMAAIDCGTERNDRVLLFGIRNSLKHLHSLTDLLQDLRNHHRDCTDVSNESLTRPVATEMTHLPSMNKEEHRFHQPGVSPGVRPIVPPASTAVTQVVSISSPRFSTQPSPSPPYNCIQLPVYRKETGQTDKMKASNVTQEINHSHESQNTKTLNANLDRQKLNARSNYKSAGYTELQSDRGTTSLCTLCVFVLGFCIAIFLVVMVLSFLPNAGKAWLWLCSYLACNVKVEHTSTPVV